MKKYNLKKGYNIRISGEAKKEIDQIPFPQEIAIKPSDFIGIKPRLLVQEGSKVKIGTPLFYSKDNKSVRVNSPVSGKIKEIVRGERRKINRLIIETDGKDTREKISFASTVMISSNPDEIMKILLKTGLFINFFQRPFAKIANPNDKPRDIFISAMDTSPLATDPSIIINNNKKAFLTGLKVISCLTEGKVNLSFNGKKNIDEKFYSNLTKIENVELHSFRGPHPAGNVGVQIHHIDPIKNANDIVWYCNVQSVIHIGSFFQTGLLDNSKIISVAGPGAKIRKYYKTVIGAPLKNIVEFDESYWQVRYISGNILTGTKVDEDDYTGYYDNLISVIPEVIDRELFGWAMPGLGKESFSRSFLSKILLNKKFEMGTGVNGSRRPFVASDIYENVLPMDIYPEFLIKSILAEDTNEMEGLGIYEVAEEDLALCEYICPSKIEFQEILRKGLDLIEESV